MRPAAGSSNNLQAMHLGPLPSPASNLTPAQQQQLARQQAEMAATGATRPIPQQQQQQLYTMQQMMIHQQLAAQQLTGRAPSPGGGPMVSAGNGSMVITVSSSHPVTNQPVMHQFPLPPEFVAEKRLVIHQHLANPVHGQNLVFNEFLRWDSARKGAATAAGGAQPSAASSAPAAKRPKVDSAPGIAPRPGAGPLPQQQTLAAMMAAGGRPPLPPGMAIPGMAVPHLTATQAAAAAHARLQASMVQRRAQFQPIVRPSTEDEKQFVPKPRLQALVKQVGQGMQIANAKATDDADEALRAVAEDFISGAVSFAVSMARRRKAEEIEPADLLLYLERTWNIQVPGFSSKDVKPYTRLQPSMDHQRRMAAVRKAMAAAASSSTKDGGVASSAAVAAGVGAPAVANGVAGGQAPAEPGARAAEPEPAAATAGDGGDGGATGAAERSPAGGKTRGKAPGKQQQAAEDVDMPNLDAAAADGEP